MKEIYACAHCPDVRVRHPGECPQCGMRLYLQKLSSKKKIKPHHQVVLKKFAGERVLLIILDGWGESKNKKGNAITNAQTPFYDQLIKNYPHLSLAASGVGVGQFAGEIGSSETGHMIIGAGRIIEQALPKITKDIISGQFYKNQAFIKAVSHVKKYRSDLHLIGLIGCGGIHSCRRHAFALLKFCRQQGVKNVWLHLITDGRDTAPQEAKRHVRLFQKEVAKLGIGQVVTIMGRYYAMDRDKRWLRTKQAYDALLLVPRQEREVIEIINTCYQEGITDEFIPPTAVSKSGRIKNNDAVIFWNLRPDRPAQLTKALTAKHFNSFVRSAVATNLYFSTMVEYGLGVSAQVAYTAAMVPKSLPGLLSRYGRSQFHIAETEKFAHVTYFFSGGCKQPHRLEEWNLVPSPKVATYDKRPAMSLAKIVGQLESVLSAHSYDFIIANFANADMVAHSGKYRPTIQAVEKIDTALKRLIPRALKNNYITCIVGDHGNAERMLDKAGQPYTSHTTNKVPFIVISPKHKLQLVVSGDDSLIDVAPTVLFLMGLSIPPEMTGRVIVSLK